MHCQGKGGFDLGDNVLDDGADIIWKVTRVLRTLADEVAQDRHICLQSGELAVTGLSSEC